MKIPRPNAIEIWLLTLGLSMIAGGIVYEHLDAQEQERDTTFRYINDANAHCVQLSIERTGDVIDRIVIDVKCIRGEQQQ